MPPEAVEAVEAGRPQHGPKPTRSWCEKQALLCLAGNGVGALRIAQDTGGTFRPQSAARGRPHKAL
jgi:hypothetical protein